MPLYLLSRRRFVSCSVFLLTMVVDCPVLSRIFRAPAECYSAFVAIVSSECESAAIRTLNSCPLRIEPAHSRVWEGACLPWRNPIDWLRTSCGRSASERRKMKSVLCGCRAIYTARCSHHQSLRNCSTRLRSLPVSAIAVRVADIHIII